MFDEHLFKCGKQFSVRVKLAYIAFRGNSQIIKSSGFIMNNSRVLDNLNKQFWSLNQRKY